MTKYILEVTAVTLLKVFTIRHRGKKLSKINIFKIITLKHKRPSVTKLIYAFLRLLKYSLLAVSFSKMTVCVSLNSATNDSLTGRKTSEMSILRLLF